MKILLVVWVGVFLVSCQPKDPLLATWKISRVTYTPSGMATPESFKKGLQWQELGNNLQNSTFALYEGEQSSFFSTRTPFRQGRWFREGNYLELSMDENARSYQFEIRNLDEMSLSLLMIDKNLTDGELTLVCTKSDQYIHDGVDLLSPEQNEWREKPAKKETAEQIKARTKAHLEYLIHYFEGVVEKKQTYFETEIISTPFVFYSHALGLSRDSRFSKRWQESFFDQEDAAIAYDLLKAGLKSVSRYPKAETFTKEYLLAFQQMRRYFDQ